MGCCNNAEENGRVLYTCSGACDLGQITDLLGRKLRKNGYARSSCSCLASIGAGIRAYVDKTKAAAEVVCIDGCPTACASKMIKKIDVEPKVYTLTKMGIPNGKVQISESLINELYNRIIAD
ncbi:MAG: putative zinc-binding protein [Veillonellales bacterium]